MGNTEPNRQSATLIGPLSFAEMIERYEGQWVLARVTDFDDESWPSHGYVVAVATTRKELSPAWKSLPMVPGEPYCEFPAYPDDDSGPEYEAAVKQFMIGLINAIPSRGE